MDHEWCVTAVVLGEGLGKIHRGGDLGLGGMGTISTIGGKSGGRGASRGWVHTANSLAWLEQCSSLLAVYQNHLSSFSNNQHHAPCPAILV